MSHKYVKVIEINIPDSIAAGQNTTYFLAVPGETELPRHPEEVDHHEACIVCQKDLGDAELEIECEKVRGIGWPKKETLADG